MENTITTRRSLLKSALSAGCIAGLPLRGIARSASQRKENEWKPKVAENILDLKESTLRWMAQLGLKYVVYQGQTDVDLDKKGYWTVEDIRAVQKKCESYGMELASLRLTEAWFPKAARGLDGRDEEIERVVRSIAAAGKAGVSMIEWGLRLDSFWDERVGYGREEGRGGARYLNFDYERVKDKPPFEEIGLISADDMWERTLYFARPMIEAAEKAGTVLSCHPNDPPVPNMRGVARILTSVEAFDRLFREIPSPANGISFCQGVFTELGTNIPDMIRHFASRLHHVHFRGVRGTMPRYTEVFIDEGDVDMLEAMKTYKEVGYTRTMVSDHTPGIEGGNFVGRSFSHGYIRALVQVVNAIS